MKESSARIARDFFRVPKEILAKKRPARTAGNAISAGREPIEIRGRSFIRVSCRDRNGRKGQAKRAQGGCLGTKGR